jgi:hypothetical protein
MDCCVLTSQEVGQLNNYGILPNHENHRHISVELAAKGINEETLVIVQGKHGRNYVTDEKTYFLKRLPSGGRGGIHIVQRVLSNHLKFLKPIHD